jgi:hypothetical protein
MYKNNNKKGNKMSSKVQLASKEDYDEFENILNTTKAKLKEIEELEYYVSLLDNKRFEMEKKFGFDPKDFLYGGKV